MPAILDTRLYPKLKVNLSMTANWQMTKSKKNNIAFLEGGISDCECDDVVIKLKRQ
jgi:hypothetical protein